EFDKKNKDQISSENFYLTYKEKKLDDSTKSRKELELKVEDGSLLAEIFKKLGFREVFTVKKERELYEFDYNGSKIEALLDYIPILKQNFIEVEMITSSENELAQIRNILFEFLNEFGIKKKNKSLILFDFEKIISIFCY
ncbi:MAG: class IV adenylate cyclase, partial [Candidatus Lokiarchaeota archaeon]|nr:class IV adenylate cyclase [Candidatus Lokiarchaeota archaeon]MBD3340037.1 class IV adenylate cyclase [Candidatus Lokiarchaeota archaeon]